MTAGGDALFVVVENRVVVREHGGDVVVPWWSFAKTLIAAAVMRLAEAGEIDLDAAVEGRDFTIRQVLRHEAGLPDYGGLADYFAAVAAGETPWPVDDLLAKVGPPVAAAGTGWAYSNIGYLWLRDLLERRRGPGALTELILRPLGMTRARLTFIPGDLEGVSMGAAGPYHPGWVYHGLVVGPLREAALGLDRLATSGLLSTESLAAMRAPTPLPQFNRPPWRLSAYGAGTMTPEMTDGGVAYGHTGAGPGSGIAVYRREATGRTVAVFALDEASIAVEGPAAAKLES
jgi:CubicO group peptidase (beta-lactamase class C family)